MATYVVSLDAVDRAAVPLVGGKGAQLGELARVVPVPPGFCVTTEAFARWVASAPAIDARLDRLEGPASEREALAATATEVRAALEATPIPDAIAAAITEAVAGHEGPWAVRSSALGEDGAASSFAGLQDSWLGVGAAAVLEHVRRCWASLYTERAVAYRRRHGHSQRSAMAVVVQRMIDPEAAGVMFTADPLSGHRKITAIEAVFGLGEALASGLVAADAYAVRDGAVIRSAVATKTMMIAACPGGTERRALPPERQRAATLSEAQVLRLAALGRRIEAHFASPQDIEWALVDGAFVFVQSRPITTLFPVPEVADDALHVYVSVGHQQMMTDAMRPLGISLWQLTAGRPMFEAGGRLFVDIGQTLAMPAARAGLLEALGRSDPLIKDALETFLARGGVSIDASGPALPTRPPPLIDADPGLVTELIANTEASIATAELGITGLSGPALFEFILADIPEMKRLLFDPRSSQAIMTAIQATWWLNDHLDASGERHIADALAAAAPDNVTADMGLALLRVADVIRPHPAVVAALERADDALLEALPALPGGGEAAAAFAAFLGRYGARCVGEIDITRPRWAERPSQLAAVLLGHVRNLAPGEADRRVAEGLELAARAEQRIRERLQVMPEAEAHEAGRMIARLRTFIGFREYPKYGMIRRYLVYKRALVAEAERLVAAGLLGQPDDAFYLRLDELHAVARDRVADASLIVRRREAFRAHRALTPPRVMTSDGEILTGYYRRDDAPAGALVGLAVSAGVVEGRARVVLDLADAALEPGDILVTRFTDPSWTPLFIGIAGLVAEVGGLMTHGSVIAREYGLPAVVGVEGATRRLHDGQRIRVDGERGLVTMLE